MGLLEFAFFISNYLNQLSTKERDHGTGGILIVDGSIIKQLERSF